MDLDAFTNARRRNWDRLRQIARSRRTSGAEADELIARYQTAATDLSAIRTAFGQTPEGDYLSVGLSRARLRMTGTPAGVMESAARFFTLQLPAALYRLRWWTLGTALFTVVVAVLAYFWVLSDAEYVRGLAAHSGAQQYAEEDFVGYYSEFSESSFAARVFTNNAWIAAGCIAFGITGVWVPYILVQNALALGEVAAVLSVFGRLDVFFLWIAPHGLLELTMVFVAAAAGLRIFWAWVAPGANTRMQSLAQEGRRLFTVTAGTTMFLFLSGLIEGYVTRQDWPWAIKIGIGALALALYLAYALLLGRRAYLAGERGDLEAQDAGARTVTAD